MANSQYNNSRQDDEFSFEIKEKIEVLGTRDNGWTKEVNIVAWNGGKSKVDVREWDPDHVRMSRGITLFEEEAEKLTRALAIRYKIGEAPAAATVPAAAVVPAAPAGTVPAQM